MACDDDKGSVAHPYQGSRVIMRYTVKVLESDNDGSDSIQSASIGCNTDQLIKTLGKVAVIAKEDATQGRKLLLRRAVLR